MANCTLLRTTAVDTFQIGTILVLYCMLWDDS
jgi:hypothetical protein